MGSQAAMIIHLKRLFLENLYLELWSRWKALVYDPFRLELHLIWLITMGLDGLVSMVVRFTSYH